MATIDIQRELLEINTGHKYLFLGDNTFVKHTDNASLVESKIAKTESEFNESFWGTLGNFDKSRIKWSGILQHSKIGRFNSEGITQELKETLIQATGAQNLSQADIRERYISFDGVNFPDDILADKTLRLTLFLNQGDGAIVYYQHFEGNETNPENNSHLGYDYDFIFPEATKNSEGLVDFNTLKRDRLNYEIDIVPKEINTDIDDEELEKKLRFVVKILTFKRNAASNENIIQRTEEKLFKSDKRYKLMVFDIEKDAFVEPDNLHDINPDLKTLFLIHGTFVDTASSYEAILNNENGQPSLLKQYLTTPENKHKQAIAFNHPTMFDDAEENTKHLMKALDDYKNGFVFNKRLDLIGTSRGALLSKYLAIENEMNVGTNPKIAVDKIITVSGANGCGYLTKGKYYINTLLKLLKKGTPAQIVLVSLAQLSVTYITTRAGLQLMTAGNPKLNYILNYNPKPHSITQVLTLCADFEVVKAKGIGKKLKNFALRIGDKVVQTMLGKEHDFVIGTIEQEISNPFPKKHLNGNKLYNAVHGKVLGKPGAWDLIVSYLNN